MATIVDADVSVLLKDSEWKEGVVITVNDDDAEVDVTVV